MIQSKVEQYLTTVSGEVTRTDPKALENLIGTP